MTSATRLFFVAMLAFAPVVVADMSFAEAKNCPPGLAKKNPPCVPPGQAKKGVTTDEWLNRDRIGEVVEQDDLTYLDDYWRYDLPQLPTGQRYAVVDDRIVVIDAETYRILQLIRLFSALSD